MPEKLSSDMGTDVDEDGNFIEKKPGQEWKENSSSIEWDQICFVRAMADNQVQIQEDKIISPTLINTTQGELPRATIHWSLNHRVAGHSSGLWNNRPLTVICPGNAMIETNEKPHSLAAFDTWWRHDIVLPNGSVIISTSDNPIPQEQLDGKGVTLIQIDIPQDLKQRVAELDQEIANLEHSDIAHADKSAKHVVLLYEKNKILDTIGDIIETEVSRQIEKLGYTIFTGDNGMYMNMRGLDKAIYDLADRENLAAGAHTGTGDQTTETAGINANAIKEPEDIDKYFGLVIETFINAYEHRERDGAAKYSDINPDQEMVILSTIFKIMYEPNFLDKLSSDPENAQLLARLFEIDPKIKAQLIEWAEKIDRKEPVVNYLNSCVLKEKPRAIDYF